MNTYKKRSKNRYKKSLKRTRKRTYKRTHKKHKRIKRKTKRNIKGGGLTSQELINASINLKPVGGVVEPTNTYMNPQFISPNSNPQTLTTPFVQGGPQDMRVSQEGDFQPPLSIPLPPQDGISNRGKGLVEDLQQKYAMNQQNIALTKGQGVLSREELMDYLEDFKRQITEIIKIDPDEDKDLSDAQGKKIIEALSSHRAKIGGLQHTLYRQNKKLMNDISTEKRKLENKLEFKFAELEKKLEKQLKAKGDKSKHTEKKTNSDSSPSKPPRRSSDKSPKKSPNKSHKTEKSPKKSNNSVQLPTQLSSNISQQIPMRETPSDTSQ